MVDRGQSRRATLQPHNLTTSQPHNLTTSQPHNLTTSQPHNLTTSQPHNLTTSQNRPDLDKAISEEAHLTILAFRGSEEDLETISRDLVAMPNAVTRFAA
ncbi:hypothetical protein ALO95_200255 [Pseudomonas syringae pv. antirrhini]|nr:hypothetical protein ALO95_200255 [Pseudomonas syringae pv. antirrhini]